MGVKNIFSTLFKSEDASREEKPLSAADVSPKRTAPVASPRAKQTFVPKGNPALLRHRWQTEKATGAEGMGQYAFAVGVRVNKTVIRDAFWALTGVRPKRVRMQWVFPKRSARGMTRQQQKKAIVTVAKGVAVNFPEQAKQ
jgi:ribosomal protein L23